MLKSRGVKQSRTCRNSILLGNDVFWSEDTSPPMRGTLPAQYIEAAHAGYIPAYAGNPDGEQSAQMQQKIQPRACGESSIPRASIQPRVDTTPRMRGIPKALPVHERFRGYNPAHAGNSSGAPDGCVRSAMQPRACGDFEQERWKPSGKFDATPRMRGIRESPHIIAVKQGCNPAHAGNSRCYRRGDPHG